MSDTFDFDSFLESQITAIDESLADVVGEYFDIGNKGQLYSTHFKHNKITQQHIDVYNNFIKKSANIICSKRIDLKDGRFITFEDLKFEKPMYQDGNVRRKQFPMHARKKFSTYDSEWSIIIVIKEHEKEVYRSPNRIVIAKIPVMLFSILCHLEGLNDLELIEVGEDPLEYGGYFIVQGAELIILLEEKLSTNRMFIMNTPSDIKNYATTLKITTNTLKGTRLDELIYNNNNIIKYSIQSLKKADDEKKMNKTKKSNYKLTKKINVIYIFQLLSEYFLDGKYCNSIEDIIGLVKQYVVNERSITALYQTIANLKSQINPFTAQEVMANKIRGKNNENYELKPNDIRNILLNIFEHLEDLSPLDGENTEHYVRRIAKMKVNLLAIMVANYADYISGYRELDDRDDWANKRLEGPGRKMEQLIRNSWNKATFDLIKSYTLEDNKNNAHIVKIFNNGIISNKITKYFRESFKNSKWGIKGSDKLQNNATQALNRDNMLASLSHINTINVKVQRTDKNKKIRMVQPTQYRYVDFFKSPEGNTCGLIKNLSNITRLSLDRGIEGDRIMLTIIEGEYSEEQTDAQQHIFILNGKYIGWIDGELMHRKLLNARRNGELYYDISFFINEKYLYADSSPSRLVAPVLIVDNKTQELIMDLKHITNLEPLNLMKEGCIEYVSAWEDKNLVVAVDYRTLFNHRFALKNAKKLYEEARSKFKERKTKENKATLITKKLKYEQLLNKNYTHCEVDGRSGFGVAADMVPFIANNQGARNIYQTGMSTQAVSVPHLNYRQRFDNQIKILESPTSPIVRTEMYDMLGLVDRGMGHNVTLAVTSAENTEEDAIIMNQGAIDRGLFRMTKIFTIQGQIKITDSIIKSYYANPEKHGQPKDKKYRNLNECGLPIIGSYLNEQDCVIGIIKEKNGIRHDDSVYLKFGEKGIVDDVLLYDTDKYEIVVVKLRITRVPKNGDKYAARFSQKGTIIIVPERDMPFAEKTGMIPDMLINVAAIPSRMTVSYLYELITGKSAALVGETVNATAFTDIDMDKWENILTRNGFNKNGNERLRDGRTGKALETEIYMGLAYIQALKHQPEDKIGVRNKGPVCSTTRAAIKGRQRGGGIRFGEMEKDVLIGHGTSANMRERMCEVSDKYKKAICSCGTDAVYNDITQDFNCPLCKTNDIGAITLPYISHYQQRLFGALAIRIDPLTGKIKLKPKEYKDDKDTEEKGSDEEQEEESDEDGYDNNDDDDDDV